MDFFLLPGRYVEGLVVEHLGHVGEGVARLEFEG